eukprot:c3367_g1_i1 orf=133-480(+)
MVRKEGFHIVEETQDYVVLLPEFVTDENVQDQDGYKSSEDTEEEINVITTCAPDIVDFISDDSANVITTCAFDESSEDIEEERTSIIECAPDIDDSADDITTCAIRVSSEDIQKA